MDIFGLSWIGDAFKELVDTIVEVYHYMISTFQGATTAVEICKNAIETYMPTALQYGLVTLIAIAVLYKILGREG